MPIIYLDPVSIPEDDIPELEKIVLEEFTFIFRPLLDAIEEPNLLENQNWDLLESSLRSGKIVFVDNYFKGSFSKEITLLFQSMGATWHNRERGYSVSRGSLPPRILNLATKLNALNLQKAEKMLDALNKIDRRSFANIERRDINLDLYFKKLQTETEKQLVKQFNSIPTIKIDYEGGLKDYIIKDYTTNLKLRINGFTQEETEKMRGIVQEYVGKGYRSARIADLIEERFNVTKNKAKFLARNETKLFVNKYSAKRHIEAGVPEYIWQIRGYHTRPDHERLSGSIQRYDTPPETNSKTHARNNPGEDYNCYCSARPFIRIP